MNLAALAGGKRPRRGENIEPGGIPGSGCLLRGDKGALFSRDDYGGAYKLFPEADFADFQGPPETIPRNQFGGDDLGHSQEWLAACRGGPAAYSNFEFAALLTETILLGNLALRVGKKVEWDGPNMRAKNAPEAAQYVRPEYRKGWTV